MAPSAADVPSKFDILIDGKGYVYHDAFTGGSSSNVPEKGIFTYTPTFVSRQNTQGSYGDNQQDFWLTFSQKDWSLGETQRFQGRDDANQRKFWQGTAIDVSTPGQVTLERSTTTFSQALSAGGGRGASTDASLVGGDSTTLYTVDASGTATSQGAHGLGNSPTSIVSDGVDIYMSTEQTGSVGIRKWDGSAFSTFSATKFNRLAFLNNTLYGFQSSTQTLQSLSTGGVATTIFTWKQADGGAGSTSGDTLKLAPFGGKLLILRSLAQLAMGELWIYDGVAPSLLTTLPDTFVARDLAVVSGVIFIGGCHLRAVSASTFNGRPAIYYYANGTLGLLWEGKDFATNGPDTFASATSLPGNVTLVSFRDGIAFTDNQRGAMMFYKLSTGAFSTLFTYTAPNSFAFLHSCLSFFIHQVTGATTGTVFPNLATAASSGTVTSSLIDFDSSLNKLFRGIKVDFDSASDGDGGSVDISYRVGDVDGSYTSLQTGATSGTEYNLSGVSGRSISIKITLNKGTSTNGPTLKRLYLRAVPVQQNFERFKVVLNCTGRAEPGVNDPQYIELHDGSIHNKDGLQMATDLRSATESTSPISVTTKFGTLSNCIIEDLTLSEIRPNEFVAEVTVREV